MIAPRLAGDIRDGLHDAHTMLEGFVFACLEDDLF
jgi:hypothetical protein